MAKKTKKKEKRRAGKKEKNTGKGKGKVCRLKTSRYMMGEQEMSFNTMNGPR